MWLPTSVYESLPATYIAVGVLFLAGVAYTGIHSTWGAIYLALGVFSILSGVLIGTLRKKARAERRRRDGGDRRDDRPPAHS